MSSFAKACVDLSNNIRNFRFTKSTSQPPSPSQLKDDSANNGQTGQHQLQQFTTSSSPVSPKDSPTIIRGATVAAIKQRLFNQGLKIEISPKKKKRTRFRDYAKERFGKLPFSDNQRLWQSKEFLVIFFSYFSVRDLCNFCLVCRSWNSIIYANRFFDKMKLVMNFKLYSDCDLQEYFKGVCNTIFSRGISNVVLEHASDNQLSSLLETMSKNEVEKNIVRVSIRCCGITDRVLQKVTETLVNLTNLEVFCCNDLSEVCLWSALVPNLTVLTLWDCINISDESLGAVTQLLPSLTEFNLQAYHVTDMALTYFNARHLTNLKTLRIVQCMDITNQGVVNIAHSLPNIRNLSLSGLSKITDDGLDVVCENMKQLIVLNLSWCPKLTDSGLECVACDLSLLEELILDRCPSVTDNGMNYLSTMPNLSKLSLRWCSGITDISLTFILSMTTLSYLSIAGCKRFTEEGICNLVRHPVLRKLEITHCKGSSERVKQYFHKHMPQCILID